MAQASRSATINVPPEKLFEVIVDYEKYPEFLPEVKKAKVEGGQGSIKEVTYMVDIKAKVITYTLKHTARSEEHTSELQSRQYLVCRLLLEKKKKQNTIKKKTYKQTY